MSSSSELFLFAMSTICNGNIHIHIIVSFIVIAETSETCLYFPLRQKKKPVFQLTFLRKIGYVSRQSCIINYYEGYTRQGSDFNSGCPKMLIKMLG